MNRTRIRRFIMWAFFPAALFAGVGWYFSPYLKSPDYAWRSFETVNIEVAIYSLLKSEHHKGSTELCFLEQGEGRDPSVETMKRMRSTSENVYPFSRSMFDSADASYVHRQTKRFGVVLCLWTLTWSHDREVNVEAGYFVGPLGAGATRYTLEHDGRSWVVTDRESLSVS